MERQVLLVHGGGGGAYAADRKLADSLRDHLGANHLIRYPEMPDEEEPDYRVWKRIILEHARDMGARGVVVGHSIGASVLAKVFTEPGEKPPVAGVFLIAAPFWHDHKVWRWDDVALSADAAEHFPEETPLHIYHGDADETAPVSHAGMYARALPQANVIRLPGRDHQLDNDSSEVARDIRALG